MRNDTDMDSWIKAKIKEEKTRLSQLLLSQIIQARSYSQFDWIEWSW